MSIFQKKIEQLVDMFDGDRFQACNYIAEKSYELVKLTGDCISSSEAQVAILTGKLDVDLNERRQHKMNLIAPKTEFMNTILKYVDNDDICQCVRESYSQSVRIGSITFYYPVHLSSEDKTRVRVLSRMCWYNQ